MSHLGIALAGQVNAVSNLNAYVASGTDFPGTHIHPITNGVHHETWTSPALANLFDAHLQGGGQIQPPLRMRVPPRRTTGNGQKRCPCGVA